MRDRCPIGGLMAGPRHNVAVCASRPEFASCFVAAARPSDSATLVAESELPGPTECNQT